MVSRVFLFCARASCVAALCLIAYAALHFDPRTGLINLGGAFTTTLLILPGMVALIAIPLGAAAGAICAARRALPTGGRFVLAGFLLSLVIPPIYLVIAYLSAGGGTGWEALIIYPAIVGGQVLTGIGLWKNRRHTR